MFVIQSTPPIRVIGIPRGHRLTRSAGCENHRSGIPAYHWFHCVLPVYSHLIAHVSGELYNVEVSARNFDILNSEDGYLAHTNNYLSPKMEAIESESDELVHTRVRYFRARRPA